MRIQMMHDQYHHHHLGITEDGHADGWGEHPDKGNVAAGLENMMAIRWRRDQVDGGDYDVVDDGDDLKIWWWLGGGGIRLVVVIMMLVSWKYDGD